jgi:hypothetical protein
MTRWQEYAAAANEGMVREENKRLSVASSGVPRPSQISGGPLPFIYNTVVDENGRLAQAPVTFYRSGRPHRLPPLVKLTSAECRRSLHFESADAAAREVLGSTFFF